MSKSRKKEPVIVVSREEMEIALREYRAARVEEQKLFAEHNEEIAAADNKLGVALQPVTERINQAFARIRAWADANPSEFEKTRSLMRLEGTLGYKLGNWTVKYRKGWTMRSVLDFMLKSRSLKKKYVRIEPELNKQALLGRRSSLMRRPGLLEKIGVWFDQEDTFFVTANLPTTDPLMKEAA
jgi:phage host-nuclease inhibitor protein Gam